MERSELTPIQAVTYDILSEICEIKRDAGLSPALATLDEIIASLRPEILEALRGFYRAGQITHNITVNKTSMFGIKQQDDE